MKKLLKKIQKEKVSLKKKVVSLKKNRKAKKIFILVAIIALLYMGRSIFIAAWVENKPIFRLSLIKELEKQGGGQVLDSLIEKSLIYQEALRAKVNISKDDIDLELANIEELVKSQGISLEEALASRGQTKKDLLGQIKLQKTVEQILKDKIVVTDEEVKAYYDESNMEEEFDTVKEEIKTNLIQGKIQDEYLKWITDLKEKARIFYFVNY